MPPKQKPVLKSKPVVVTPEKLAHIRKALSHALSQLEQFAEGSDNFIVACHVQKGDRIQHRFLYENAKQPSWGPVVIATAVEAKRAEMLLTTAVNKT